MKEREFLKSLPNNIVFERKDKGTPLFKCLRCLKRYRKLSFAKSHDCKLTKRRVK